VRKKVRVKFGFDLEDTTMIKSDGKGCWKLCQLKYTVHHTFVLQEDNQ